MNKVMFVGRLTKDPEISIVGAKSTPKCVFTIAITDRFDKEKADFARCTAWGKTGTFIADYFTVGRRIGVFCRFKSSTWEDEQGNKKYGQDFVVEEAYFVDNKKDADSGATKEPTGDQGYQAAPDQDDDELPF